MKTLKQLEKQKEKIEKQIEELKNKVEFRRFKCLPDIEVSYIKNHTETFDKIKIPKGCRLLKAWEFAKLIESDEADEFFQDYKGKYNYFFLEQTKYAKNNNIIFRAYLNGVGGWNALGGDLAVSNGNGRVVFVKDVGGKK